MAPPRTGTRVAVMDVLGKVLADYRKDRRLCVSLSLGMCGLAYYTIQNTSQPKLVSQFAAARTEAKARAAARAAKRRDRKKKIASAAPGASDDAAAIATTTPAKPPAPARPHARKQAAVDGTFVKRMAFILQIVVPSLNSKEAALLAIQTLLLVSRSFISLRIARKGGDGLQAVMEHSWKKFGIVLGDFFVSGVAASVVNSALKYMTNSISLSFRQRLTTYVHQRYLSDQAYYRAAVLRVGNLDNADQRIADDLNQFCHTASDLFSRTFKPLLDVILSTMRMGENMGYGGLVVLYSYFLFSGAVIRAVSPPFSEYIARSQKLEGDFRRMHSRLITHAEEVAFLDGSDRERAILDQKLEATTTWQQFYFYLQFKQGVIDQYFVKYFASMIGWPVLAFPFLTKAGHGGRSPGEIAARYRESDTLIQSASSSVGDLMMVYKKLQRLSGFTARVVELLEAVDSPTYHDLLSRTPSHGKLPSGDPENETTTGGGSNGTTTENGVKNIVAALEKKLSAPRGGPTAAAEKVRTGADGVVLSGAANDGVRFDRVSVYSPDGRLLVKDVSFDLKPGENLFVTGANGAGKTSLFRVLAGLWEPASGVVTRPDVQRSDDDDDDDDDDSRDASEEEEEGGTETTSSAASRPFQVFYVPQKPYLVSGSLRDQVMYPRAGSSDFDDEIIEALSRVNLLKLVNAHGLDRVPHDWADVLSGGEKQRVGLARLYFHKPSYAVLDEATSAINPDEEGSFYDHLGTLGITAFSIAHRMELKKFHHSHLHFHADGTGGWTLKRIKK